MALLAVVSLFIIASSSQVAAGRLGLKEEGKPTIEDTNSGSLLAAGVSLNPDGSVQRGAEVTAFRIVEIPDGERWIPIASTRAAGDGSFQLRANFGAQLERFGHHDSEVEEYHIGFMSKNATSLGLYTTYYDASKARAGLWVVEDATAEVSVTDSLDGPNGQGTATSSGTADLTSGLIGALVDAPSTSDGFAAAPLSEDLSTVEGGRAAHIQIIAGATDVAAGQRSVADELAGRNLGLNQKAGTRTEFDQAQRLPSHNDCYDKFGGNRYSWVVEWRNWRSTTNKSIRSTYFMTHGGGTAEMKATTLRKLRMEVKFTGASRGSLGYYRESDNSSTSTVTAGAWKDGYRVDEMRFRQQGFYCSRIESGIRRESHYMSHYRYAPDTWTGGNGLGSSSLAKFRQNPATNTSTVRGPVTQARSVTVEWTYGFKLLDWHKVKFNNKESSQLTYKPAPEEEFQTLVGRTGQRDSYWPNAARIQQQG